jgi:hypothetical protein
MAMTQKTKNRLEGTIADLKVAKHISPGNRDDYIEFISEAAEGTNGLTLEEKTQANAQNLFNLCYLFIRDKIESGSTANGFWPLLFRMIERCSWQIVTITGIVSVTLILRPQIAAVIEHICTK